VPNKSHDPDIPGKVSVPSFALHRLAAKYIWWKSPEEAMRQPWLVAARVMDIGDWDDVQLLAGQTGRKRTSHPVRLTGKGGTCPGLANPRR